MDVHRQNAVLVGGARPNEFVILLSVALSGVVSVVSASLLGVAGHCVQTSRHDRAVQGLRVNSVESANNREVGNHLALVRDAEELSRNVQERLVAIGHEKNRSILIHGGRERVVRFVDDHCSLEREKGSVLDRTNEIGFR